MTFDEWIREKFPLNPSFTRTEIAELWIQWTSIKESNEPAR